MTDAWKCEITLLSLQYTFNEILAIVLGSNDEMEEAQEAAEKPPGPWEDPSNRVLKIFRKWQDNLVINREADPYLPCVLTYVMKKSENTQVCQGLRLEPNAIITLILYCLLTLFDVVFSE